MLTLTSLIAVFFAIMPVHATERQNLPPRQELISTTTIEAYVRQKSVESGLWPDLYLTLKYESWDWENGQSFVKVPTGPNGREDSWGVCQIHLPSNLGVSKEQALSPEFCVNWTIEQWKAGHQNWWTGYRLLKAGVI